MSINEFRNLARTVVAFTDPAHALFIDDATSLPRCSSHNQPCVNLTIALLPSPKLEYLERMMRAIVVNIPAFAGEIIILDQLDNPVFDEALAAEAEKHWPGRWKCIHQGGDVGSPVAKNKALGAASRDWLLILDPRTVLNWNPLQLAEEDIIRSGALVLNLARVDYGGKFVGVDHVGLCVDEAGIHLEGRAIVRASVHERGENTFAFCSAIDSSSLLARVDILRNTGGFNEALDHASSDIELSIRLYRQGLKIAVSQALAIYDDALESPNVTRMQVAGKSDHPCLRAEFDGQAFARSFSSQVDWSSEIVPRPKVTLVIDVDNWAFGNIARQICRYLSDRFEFQVIPIALLGNISQVLMLAEPSEIVHFFWREDVMQIGTSNYNGYAERLGMSPELFGARFEAKAITTSIYDHLLQDKASLNLRNGVYKRLAGYSVANDTLLSFYRNCDDFPPPWGTTEDGVDLTLFKPKNLARLISVRERELVIGWAGNSKWEGHTEDFKGLHTILRPAVEELQSEGFRIRLHLADRQVRMIPHDEMPEYYAEIDVYVCSSKIEGTPNPVLEAMACGVPVVSTNVGIVPQAFGRLQQEFILPERSKDCLKEQIRKLLLRPDFLVELSQENLRSIQAWDWSLKVENFAQFFFSVLKKSRGENDSKRALAIDA